MAAKAKAKAYKRKKARRPKATGRVVSSRRTGVPRKMAHSDLVSLGGDFSEDTGLGQGCDAALVIAKDFAEYLTRVLAKQGSGNRFDDRRQCEIERRFDVGNSPCLGVRNLANTVAIPRLRRVEGLLDGAKIADRNIRRLHLGDPIFPPSCAKTSARMERSFSLLAVRERRSANSPL